MMLCALVVNGVHSSSERTQPDRTGPVTWPCRIMRKRYGVGHPEFVKSLSRTGREPVNHPPKHPEPPYGVLPRLSTSYLPLRGRYGRVTQPSAAEVLLLPLDLHVLGMSPTLVLSQDQTLKKSLCTRELKKLVLKRYRKDDSFCRWLHVLFRSVRSAK